MVISMTYSVEQLTAGGVVATSVRLTYLWRMIITSASVEFNDLNRCLSLAIVIVGYLPPKSL